MRILTKTQIITIISFMAYAIYEPYAKQWEKTVDAPIRTDLILIYPFLIIITLISVFQLIKKLIKRNKSKKKDELEI